MNNIYKNIELVTLPPRRTPAIVSDKISGIIKNKVVCELGCAEGDNMLLMQRFAKEVIGIDLNNDRLGIAIKRKLDVRVSDYRVDNLPEADIYYFWPSNVLRDTPYLIWKIFKTQNFQGIIISGSDSSIRSERFISYIFSIFSCLKIINYNEGQGHREFGTFHLNIMYASNFNGIFMPILGLMVYGLRLLSFIKLRLKDIAEE